MKTTPQHIVFAFHPTLLLDLCTTCVFSSSHLLKLPTAEFSWRKNCNKTEQITQCQYFTLYSDFVRETRTLVLKFDPRDWSLFLMVKMWYFMSLNPLLSKNMHLGYVGSLAFCLSFCLCLCHRLCLKVDSRCHKPKGISA